MQRQDFQPGPELEGPVLPSPRHTPSKSGCPQSRRGGAKGAAAGSCLAPPRLYEETFCKTLESQTGCLSFHFRQTPAGSGWVGKGTRSPWQQSHTLLVQTATAQLVRRGHLTQKSPSPTQIIPTYILRCYSHNYSNIAPSNSCITHLGC